MRFSCIIDCDNAAFSEHENSELSGIILKLAAALEIGATAGTVRDSNGNACGAWQLSEDGKNVGS